MKVVLDINAGNRTTFVAGDLITVGPITYEVTESTALTDEDVLLPVKLYDVNFEWEHVTLLPGDRFTYIGEHGIPEMITLARSITSVQEGVYWVLEEGDPYEIGDRMVKQSEIRRRILNGDLTYAEGPR